MVTVNSPKQSLAQDFIKAVQQACECYKNDCERRWVWSSNAKIERNNDVKIIEGLLEKYSQASVNILALHTELVEHLDDIKNNKTGPMLFSWRFFASGHSNLVDYISSVINKDEFAIDKLKQKEHDKSKSNISTQTQSANTLNNLQQSDEIMSYADVVKSTSKRKKKHPHKTF